MKRAFALSLLLAGLGHASPSAELPDYQPAHQVSGVIRSWGNGHMAGPDEKLGGGFS